MECVLWRGGVECVCVCGGGGVECVVEQALCVCVCVEGVVCGGEGHAPIDHVVF